ncbi:MAG: AAA family ATPase [Acidobacteriota bacterium]|nr:AAA family ATPase [Acidobacteriota bacterium]
MILKRSHILGFGKLRNRLLDFHAGLNLVFAENEGGKSTLQRFLVGLLYGQLRADLRVQRRLDPWVEQYKPWHGNEYGGILWAALADGREIEMHRFFGKEETRIEIRTSTGEDITRNYERQRNGEVLFAPFHLGMPKDLFESVAMIRENKVAEIYGYGTIRDRIANLAQSGDEELSIRWSLDKLQEKLDSVGSDRAPTKPYKQAQDLLQSLREEQAELRMRRCQFQSWIEDRNRTAVDIAKMERELAKVQSALLLARRREAAARVESLEEIDGDLRRLAVEIESLGAREDFPSENLEELNQLMGARDSIAKQLVEVRAERELSQELLAQAESERRELALYAEFAASSEAEKVTEWFVSYLSVSLQKDGLQKTMNRLQNEIADLQTRLSGLNPPLADPDTDWQRVAREAVEDEQAAAQNSAILAERITRARSSQAAASSSALRLRMLGGAAWVFSALILTARYAAGVNLFSSGLDLGISAALAIVGVILFLVAQRAAARGHQEKQALAGLEKEIQAIRTEGGKKQNHFQDVIRECGFHRAEDFLAAAKQAEQDRQKLADLNSRLMESEQQRQRLEEQSDEWYASLKEALAKVGLSCSPGNLKFQIDVLRANLRRFRELDARYDSCEQKANAARLRDEERTKEYDMKCARIRSLLDHARVDTPEQFREGCARRQKLLELRERTASRTREFNRLAGDRTLRQWKDRLAELMTQPLPPCPVEPDDDKPVEENGSPERLLPYQPSIAEAEEQEKRLSARLAGAREEYARIVERIHQAFQSCRPDSEIEEDLVQAEQNLQKLETNRLALTLALETIEKLSRQQQEVLAPQLNAAVEQRFLRLCRHRYEEIKIDPDFQVWVRELDSGELRSAEHLSRGTQDQIYFSLRFGILDLVSNEAEACPCLLDEPFAAYDRLRLKEAFEILKEEAQSRQLILFTCREDLLELARSCEATIIELANLPDA